MSVEEKKSPWPMYLPTIAFWGIQAYMIILKLNGNSELNWFWTLSPIIFVVGLGLLSIVLIVIAAFIVTPRGRKKRK